MAIDAVLFDLEGTLVNVDAISHLREARRWNDYVSRVSETAPYPGVLEVLQELQKRQVRWAVVTNVPSNLANAILQRHGLQPHATCCFHDVPKGQHKPHPAMCHKVLATLQVQPSAAIGVGDGERDARAFLSAGVRGYCAAWNPAAQLECQWAGSLESPHGILDRLTP